MSRPEDRVRARFFARVAKADGCWLWTGTTQYKGYGVFYRAKRVRVGAHRVSWELHFGPIPDGAQVLHRCDNPPCVNPEHLFLGDNTANVADKVSKGRCASMKREQNPMWRNFACAIRGEQVTGSKLDAEQVMEIRRLHACGRSQNSLARQFGVRQSSVWAIVHFKAWTHIGPGTSRNYPQPSTT